MLIIDCKSCGARFGVDVEAMPEVVGPEGSMMWHTTGPDDPPLYYCIFCSSAEPAEDK